MVGEIAVDIVHGPHFQPLGIAQGLIIPGREMLAEVEIVHQIADLQRIGNRRRRIGRSGSRKLLGRTVQVGQDPLLFDGVDAVDQTPFGVADLENPALLLQNLLRKLLTPRRVLAQPLAHALYGVHDRILAQLQLRVLTQQRHVLRVAFQPGDTGLHLRLLGMQRTGSQKSRAQRIYENLAKHSLGHLHHLMKKICISPKISRRPSSISSELETLNAAGIAEKLSIEPTSPNPGPTLPIEATEPVKLVVRSTPSTVPKTVPARMNIK